MGTNKGDFLICYILTLVLCSALESSALLPTELK